MRPDFPVVDLALGVEPWLVVALLLLLLLLVPRGRD